MGEAACSPSCAGRLSGRPLYATLLVVQEVPLHRHQHHRRHHQPKKQRLLPTLNWQMSIVHRQEERQPEVTREQRRTISSSSNNTSIMTKGVLAKRMSAVRPNGEQGVIITSASSQRRARTTTTALATTLTTTLTATPVLRNFANHPVEDRILRSTGSTFEDNTEGCKVVEAENRVGLFHLTVSAGQRT